MPRSSLEFAPGLFLDARRAVWFAEEKALAVADLHLAYAWGSRAAGVMLPVEAPDDTVPRLCALVQDYGARQVFVLGDIVHRAVSLAPLRRELQALCSGLQGVALRLLAGNHDRGLARVLGECGLGVTLETHARLGDHLLLHGDATGPEVPGRTFIGHEHPSIRVGDGVASVKCPCLLLGPRLVVLPAFTHWAAGSPVTGGIFLSPFTREAKLTQAVAILAGKLLPMPCK